MEVIRRANEYFTTGPHITMISHIESYDGVHTYYVRGRGSAIFTRNYPEEVRAGYNNILRECDGHFTYRYIR